MNKSYYSHLMLKEDEDPKMPSTQMEHNQLKAEGYSHSYTVTFFVDSRKKHKHLEKMGLCEGEYKHPYTVDYVVDTVDKHHHAKEMKQLFETVADVSGHHLKMTGHHTNMRRTNVSGHHFRMSGKMSGCSRGIY